MHHRLIAHVAFQNGRSSRDINCIVDGSLSVLAKLAQPGRKNMYLHGQADCREMTPDESEKQFRTLTRHKMIFFCHTRQLCVVYSFLSLLKSRKYISFRNYFRKKIFKMFISNVTYCLYNVLTHIFLLLITDNLFTLIYQYSLYY